MPENNTNHNTSDQFVYNPQTPEFNAQAYLNRESITEQQVKALRKQAINKLLPSKEGGFLRGFSIRPDGVNFATQNNDEEIFVLVRKHWITNIMWIIRNIFYSILPFLIVMILELLKVKVPYLSAQHEALALVTYYSIIFTNVFKNFVDWYYDPYIVTNERIVHYEFKPFVSYDVKEAMLEDIEGVEEKSAGFIAGFFNYGNIIVRTAAQGGAPIIFEKVPDPTRVRNIISDLAEIAKDINERFNR